MFADPVPPKALAVALNACVLVADVVNLPNCLRISTVKLAALPCVKQSLRASWLEARRKLSAAGKKDSYPIIDRRKSCGRNKFRGDWFAIVRGQMAQTPALDHEL